MHLDERLDPVQKCAINKHCKKLKVLWEGDFEVGIEVDILELVDVVYENTFQSTGFLFLHLCTSASLWL